ncbi:hypothetical protein E0493_05435 [Roseomonas sp. M0104]|uniref:Uncharacterized protein n=1 Tax=Teichococcus coralli TaxID=2545983 RepID=A0A845BBR1_9PROT|nr:hypothetical protein [Pseudoroseomonas coralli]MXP62792.1 hypothetical protein [Pseudoroseomonas coralli]
MASRQRILITGAAGRIGQSPAFLPPRAGRRFRLLDRPAAALADRALAARTSSHPPTSGCSGNLANPRLEPCAARRGDAPRDATRPATLAPPSPDTPAGGRVAG